MDYVKGMFEFITKSPNSFFAIANASKELEEAGYVWQDEVDDFKIKLGDKLYFTRNDSALIALNIGKNCSKDDVVFHIIVSHADSPGFKVKPVSDSTKDIYNKVNIENYGGLIKPSWLDRPLSVAGRVMVKENDKVVTKLVNIDKDIIRIPNLCIHFSKDINDGHVYDNVKDMQAFIAQELEGDVLKEQLAKEVNAKLEDIVSFDLFVYNREKPILWGLNDEYISSPRLDDLACLYPSLEAFKESENDKVVNVLYIADNEEVGSSSRQGAASEFLKSILKRVTKELGWNRFRRIIANSYLISADNAHAVHPNQPKITDPHNKAYMNKGLVIKFNASQSYTTDSFSSAIFQEICKKAGEPYQFYSNSSKLRGGSTLGNILIRSLPFISVDVGLAQLAMHSSNETMGAKDIESAIKVFKTFYTSSIKIRAKEFTVK